MKTRQNYATQTSFIQNMKTFMLTLQEMLRKVRSSETTIHREK